MKPSELPKGMVPASVTPSQSAPSATGPAAADQLKLQMQIQQLRDNQNLAMGITGGALGAVVGSVLWALITYATGWQAGIMAIGVGFLVGLGVRKLGQGIDKQFGVVGAILSLVGCVMGNLLTASVYIASTNDVSILLVLANMTPSLALEVLTETFHPMDVLFYGLAVYYGYKYSIHVLIAPEPAPAPTKA